MSDSASSFSAWVNANQGRFSKFDYLHAIYKTSNLHPDFVQCLADVIWPAFEKHGEKIFIAELFNAERYQEYLAQGRSEGEVQAWLNLLEITGVFENIEVEPALVFAETIARAWNAKLDLEFGEGAAQANVIYEQEEGEVFITIGHF